ncbi:hypothetical protein QTJ16_000055 [Diplocarpon rosae]|uniref:NAD(P)-binding protein n=1 Tax=Diplocarpon rosae TaxID=946125 RepID=A0AAD9WFB3_9HELO|nr:hypothetical protein QTJ16_000055 [Diplocarpon rosae]
MGIRDFALANKIAVVTGGGSGICLAFSQLAVHRGARVLIADLRLTSLAEEFLKTADPEAVKFVKCDVTKRADLENLIAVSEQEFGDVPDVYVPGAGVFEPTWSNFWDDTEEDRYAEVDININHPIKLSRIAIRALLSKNKKGVILITASVAGFAGSLSAPLYTATKHAVVGFIRSLAVLDEREGIKVLGIAPGMVKTPLWTDRPDKMAQYSLEDSKSGYILPEEVAQDMVELIEDGKYESGICLETTAAGKRVLGTWDIAKPEEHMTDDFAQTIERTYGHALATMKKERAA